MQSSKCSLFPFFFGYSLWGGGDFGSGSDSKFNCAARVRSGQTISGTGRVRETSNQDTLTGKDTFCGSSQTTSRISLPINDLQVFFITFKNIVFMTYFIFRSIF